MVTMDTIYDVIAVHSLAEKIENIPKTRSEWRQPVPLRWLQARSMPISRRAVIGAAARCRGAVGPTVRARGARRRSRGRRGRASAAARRPQSAAGRGTARSRWGQPTMATQTL